MNRKLLKIFLLGGVILLFASCSQKPTNSFEQQESVSEKESKEAKALLQGIWINEETEELSFRAVGDTIFFPDTISQPTYFKIVKDSLVLESVRTRYPIVKQLEHVFWFKNQNGDIVKLQKSDDPIHLFAFVQNRPQILSYTEVVKTDSVVFYDNQRYHWYLAINPTKYKVHSISYSDDGVSVDNVYYDNIMHISVFEGSKELFSSDFRKHQYNPMIPKQFLDKSVLSSMRFTGVDAQGLHFESTVCIPEGAACYKTDNIISFKGKLTTKLVEY